MCDNQPDMSYRPFNIPKQLIWSTAFEQALGLAIKVLSINFPEFRVMSWIQYVHRMSQKWGLQTKGHRFLGDQLIRVQLGTFSFDSKIWFEFRVQGFARISQVSHSIHPSSATFNVAEFFGGSEKDAGVLYIIHRLAQSMISSAEWRYEAVNLIHGDRHRSELLGSVDARLHFTN